MNDAKTRTALIVLGMHRSGTSALAGVLSRLGVQLGSSLVDANPEVNSRGFWENREVLALHERILRRLGATWHDVGRLPNRWWEEGELSDLQREAGDLLSREFSDASVWGIKDPRLCRLLPFWYDVLDGGDVEIVCVLIHREPEEVAASLQRRDSIRRRHGFLLWLQHALDAELYSGRYRRVFISYEELLNDWRATAAKIRGMMSVPWPEDPERVRTEVSDFIDCGLRHHHASPDRAAGADLLVDWAHECSVLMITAGHDDSATTRSRFVRLRQTVEERFDGFADLIRERELRSNELELRFAEAMRQLRVHESNFSELNSRIEDIDQGFRNAVEMLELRDRELAEARGELKALRSTDGGFSVAQPVVDAEPSPASTPVWDKVYDGVIDFRVANNSHTQQGMLLNVHSQGRPSRVLEVGCATGYFGRALKDAGHEVWGIEMSETAASRARDSLDRVFVTTIEEFLDSDAAKSATFDYLVFGDVLEHMVAPDEILRRCRPLLAAGGAIVASIPNVTHRAVRVMLLEGRWDYSEEGILDRTHLRFFSRDGVMDLFTSAGYRIGAVNTVTVSVEQTGIDVDRKLEAAVRDLIVDEEGDVFQFVILAEPDDDPQSCVRSNARYKVASTPRILCLPPLPEWTIGDLRLRDPIRSMIQANGGRLRFRDLNQFDAEDVEWADTVVFQREANPFVLRLFENLQAQGKRIIFDIDDLLTEVPSFLSVYKHSRRVREYLQEALRMADAITVTTPRLKKEMEAYNRNVYVIPNCAVAQFDPVRHQESASCVTLLVASSDSVRVDFVVPSLKRLMANHGSRIRLLGVGPPGEYLRQQGLSVDVYPIMGHDQFRAFLSTLDNGIGLIPLDESRFSQSKSAIKFIDFALAGIPAICSNTPPYSDVVKHGATGILCDNQQEPWYEQVTALVASSQRRRTLADNARSHALRYYPMSRAGREWFEMLRVVSPRQGQRGSRVLKRSNLQTLASQLLNSSSYRAALHVYRAEGLNGLKRRFRRYLRLPNSV